MEQFNFAHIIGQRCVASSRLIDAAAPEPADGDGLNSRISRSGACFSAQGLVPGDRVIIACRLSRVSAIAYLGALHAGLVTVPVETSTFQADGAAFVAATGAKAIWCESDHFLPESASCGVIRITGDTSLHPDTAEAVPRQADDLAVLMSTSGSTGTPRFVMQTHGNLLANTEAIARSQKLGQDERAMLILPLSYCFGASVLHSHLYCGGSVVFDSRFMFPDKVLHAIGEHECTTFAGVPSVYQILLRRSHIKSAPLQSLRRFLQAGGKLDWTFIEEYSDLFPDKAFHVMYGQTEATARITCLEAGRLHQKIGSVGRPLDNLRVKVVDEDGAELHANQTGRILVSGPSISCGYWNDPEATATAFVGGWLDTRDIGRMDEDGYLWIEGRNGDFMKVRGKRLSFGEVERRVLEFDGVQDTAVCAINHPEAGEAPAVFIVPCNGVDGTKLAESIKTSLPPAWTCTNIHIIEQLPLTDRGKLDRRTLLEQAQAFS